MPWSEKTHIFFALTPSKKAFARSPLIWTQLKQWGSKSKIPSVFIMSDDEGSLGVNGEWKKVGHVIANMGKCCFFIFTWFCRTVAFMHRILHIEAILQSNELKKGIHNVRIGRNTLFPCSVCTYQWKRRRSFWILLTSIMQGKTKKRNQCIWLAFTQNFGTGAGVVTKYHSGNMLCYVYMSEGKGAPDFSNRFNPIPNGGHTMFHV